MTNTHMKYKTLATALALSAGLINPTLCDTVLESVQKLETHAAALTAASKVAPGDGMLALKAKNLVDKRDRLINACVSDFGEDWRDHWGEGNTYANPDDVLADLYVSRNEFNGAWVKRSNLSNDKLMAILDYIAAKEPVSFESMTMVRDIAIHHPGVAAKVDQLAAFLPSRGIHGEEYYNFRNTAVLCRDAPGNRWQSTMKTAEWFDLVTANAHFSPETFTIGRDHLLLRAAKLLADKRQEAGQSVEGSELEAAFAPVVAALRAPKFQGLRIAVRDLEIDMKIPANIDWSKQEAIANSVVSAAERNGKFLASWGEEVPYEDGLGSVMLVKGETAYKAWCAAMEADD